MANPTGASKRVAYYYDRNPVSFLPTIFMLFFFCLAEVGNYNYGPGHPMKPHRIRMVHSLLVNYGVYRHLQIYVLILFLYCLSFTYLETPSSYR